MFGRNLLVDDELLRLNDSILDVLENVGILYQSEHILKSLSKIGAKVDFSKQTAFLPRKLIESVICEHKRRQETEQTEVEQKMSVEGEYRVGIHAHVAQFYYDYDQKEKHPGNIKDFVSLIHFGDAFDENVPVSHVLTLTEVPFLVEPLEAILLLLKHTQRVGSSYPYFAEQFPYLAEIGEIWCGDEKRFLHGGVFMTSPLRMCKRACDFMQKKLTYGMPCYVGTQPISGISAPVTIAANIIIGACEILGGWAVSFAINPEIPLHGAVCSGVCDMRTGNASFCSPEAMLQDLGLVELFRKMYGGGVWVAGCSDYTDAKLPGLQAAYEKTFEALTIAAFTGSPPRMGSGLLESGKTFSPVQLLLDKEMGEALWKFAKGIDVNENSIALDVIHRVGAGLEECYLETEHTLENFRTALWRPQFFDRSVWQGGEEEISRKENILSSANERYKEILSQYKQPEVDSEKLHAVELVVKRAYHQLLK